MDSYPKIKFHVRGGGSITVTTAAQEKALGGDWVDHRAIQSQTPLPEPEKKRGRQKAVARTA